jgi:SAM-dependent methyltransferase
MPTCNLCGTFFETATNLLWKKDGFDIVECPVCTLICRAEMPSRDELSAVYGDEYFRQAAGDIGGQGYLDYVAGDASHRATARGRLRLLARYVEAGELLDVGTAAGFFVDEAGRAGWTASGIDIAPSMVEWGRRELGVRLIATDLAGLPLEPGSLDAVTMWDYIEHSRDPQSDIRSAHRFLRPGGLLAMSTGDIATPAARISGSRWHLLTPRHHNYFFSADTLRQLLEANGFDILHLKHPGATYSLSYLAHKVRTVHDSRATRALVRSLERWPIGRLAVPANLRDIATVVAVRRASAADRERQRPVRLA